MSTRRRHPLSTWGTETTARLATLGIGNKEFAEHLAVNVSTVYRWLRNQPRLKQLGMVERRLSELEDKQRREALVQGTPSPEALLRLMSDFFDHHRVIEQNVADVIWISEMPSSGDLREITFTYHTPSVLEQRGYTQSEANQLSLQETLTPSSLELAQQRLDRELQAEKSGHPDPRRVVRMELENKCKDGSTIWTEESMRFQRENGVPKAIVGVSRDATDRRRIRSVLREVFQGVGIEVVLESVDLAIQLVDKKYCLTKVNEQFSVLLGYSRSDIEGQSIDSITHPEDVEESRRMFTEMTKPTSSDGYVLHKRYRHRSGHYVSCVVVVSQLQSIQPDDPVSVGLVEQVG